MTEETTYFKTTPQFYKNCHITIDKPTYLLIVKTFLLCLSKQITEEGKIIKLPFGLGLLGILKKKPAKGTTRPKNYNLFKKDGISVPLSNLHSDGYIARLLWKKTYPHSEPLIQRIGVNFKFTPARAFNRNMASFIKTNNIHKYYDNN